MAAYLTRLGLGRLKALEPKEPVRRYQRELCGELLHLDVKKLGRFDRTGHRITSSRLGRSKGAGWDFVHVAIDDATRLAYVEVLPDEKRATTTGFLVRALRWFRNLGVRIERVMSDNGSPYVSKLFRKACRWLAIKHIRTRPYTPKTTARPSASSRPSCANGPTPSPSRAQSTAPMTCPDGLTSTTDPGLTQPSAADRPSWPSARNNVLRSHS